MTQPQEEKHEKVGKPRLLQKIAASIACSITGWLAMIAYLFISYFQHADVSPRWFAMPLVIGYSSLVVIAGVWLLVVLPAFVIIRPSSWFWRFPVTPVILGSLGVLVVAFRTHFNYAYPWGRFWLIAGIVGFATGLAASVFQRHLHKRITQAEHAVAPNRSLLTALKSTSSVRGAED